jgi:Presenilin enhancer-2 subunit of gamma secretase
LQGRFCKVLVYQFLKELGSKLSSKMEDQNDQSTVDVESGERLRPSAVRSAGAVTWPTVDGPLGVSWEEAEGYARRFYLWGFAFLPLLWAVNCFYFWPVLVSKASPSPPSFNRIRPCKCCPFYPRLFVFKCEICLYLLKSSQPHSREKIF